MLWSSHLSISIKLCLSRSDLYAYFFFLLFLTLKHKWFTCCWMNIPQFLKGAMTISTLPVIGFNVATEWATTLLWNHSAILFRDIFFFLQKSHSKITSVVLILHRVYIYFLFQLSPLSCWKLKHPVKLIPGYGVLTQILLLALWLLLGIELETSTALLILLPPVPCLFINGFKH